MLAVYFVLGVFLLLAVRRSGDHRSLIAFTGWGTLAHDAVMAVQAAQLKQLRSELLPLILVAVLCVALIALPPKQREAVSERGLRESAIGIERS